MQAPQEPRIDSQETALKILIQGVNLAQSRGAYNLSEAALLDKCIKMFRRPENQVVQPEDSVVVDDDSEKKDDDVEVENISI